MSSQSNTGLAAAAQSGSPASSSTGSHPAAGSPAQTSNRSPTPASNRGGAGGGAGSLAGLTASQKQVLSEDQKKANHIASEKKRRNNIREQYDKLADMIPGMAGQGRSEGRVLEEAVKMATQLVQERKAMIDEIKNSGGAVDPKLYDEIEKAMAVLREGSPRQQQMLLQQQLQLQQQDLQQDEQQQRQQSQEGGSSNSQGIYSQSYIPQGVQPGANLYLIQASPTNGDATMSSGCGLPNGTYIVQQPLEVITLQQDGDPTGQQQGVDPRYLQNPPVYVLAHPQHAQLVRSNPQQYSQQQYPQPLPTPGPTPRQQEHQQQFGQQGDRVENQQQQQQRHQNDLPPQALFYPPQTSPHQAAAAAADAWDPTGEHQIADFASTASPAAADSTTDPPGANGQGQLFSCVRCGWLQ